MWQGAGIQWLFKIKKVGRSLLRRRPRSEPHHGAGARYLGRKSWPLVPGGRSFVALLLNFLLPRLIPGNPVDAIVGQHGARAGRTGEAAASRSTSTTCAEFGLDKPMWQQFLVYVGNLLQGDLGHLVRRSTRRR